ncbi:MAG: putative phosphoserine phosphatase 2 [Candidatus Heimdallarchaeota archaeon LC_2]|nr:MAG: putative phosphoserine phosphatase 2 [Candidatus Heimdallarchaeota archaeon LC_2]
MVDLGHSMRNRSIKLYLIRHCEDKASQLRKFEDLKLTINGEQQARNIADFLKNYKINRIFVSPKLAAKQTGQLISDKLKVSLIESNLLRDRDVGIAKGLSYKQVQHKFSNILSKSTSEINFKFPQGESNGDVYERSKQFIQKYIFTSGGTNENLVIISHSLTLIYLIYVLHNIGFQPELNYLFEHGMGCILNKEHGKMVFRIVELKKMYEEGTLNNFQ